MFIKYSYPLLIHSSGKVVMNIIIIPSKGVEQNLQRKTDDALRVIYIISIVSGCVAALFFIFYIIVNLTNNPFLKVQENINGSFIIFF